MSIQNLLQQVATIYTFSGRNKFGRDQSGASTVVKCRFQNKRRELMALKNQQPVVLLGVFYFAPDVVVNTEDRIVYQGINYKVFSSGPNIDGRGNARLLKVEVEKWQT